MTDSAGVYELIDESGFVIYLYGAENLTIYLVGSTSFGYFRDYYGQLEIIYNKLRYGYQYENFIVWR